MEIFEAIETRRSIRAFRPDPIPGDVMKRILQAASASPSYTNTQPWEVVVVSGKKRDQMAEKLLGLAKAKAPTAPDLPKPKAWPAALDARSHEHGAAGSAPRVGEGRCRGEEKLSLGNFEFYGAPALPSLHGRIAGRVVDLRHGALRPDSDPGGALARRGKLPAGLGDRLCAGDKKIPRRSRGQKAGYRHIPGLPGREGRIEYLPQQQAKTG